jgi:hypothetical protein
MARIRSIKPEFWTSAQVMDCSSNARLLFIGMWNFADDAGRMAYSPKTLKAQIYPSDDITIADIKDMIVELSSNGLVLIYSAEDKEFIQVTGWHHQKIDRPKPSKFPAPFVETSPTDRRTIAPDLILSDPIGREEDAASAAHSSNAETDYYRRVKEVCGPSSGGLGKKLLTAKQNSVALARAAVEQASEKSDPREYLGAIIRGREQETKSQWAF